MPCISYHHQLVPPQAVVNIYRRPLITKISMLKPYSAKILDIRPRKHPLPLPSSSIILAQSTTSNLESLITLHGIDDTSANCCIYCCHAQHTKFKDAITTNNLSPNHNKQLNNRANTSLVGIDEQRIPTTQLLHIQIGTKSESFDI